MVDLIRVRAIAAGEGHSLALSHEDDDIVITWGDNSTGQLGDGSLTPRDKPVTIQSNLRHIISIGGGFRHSLAAG